MKKREIRFLRALICTSNVQPFAVLMIKYVTVSNSRFHFPAVEIGTPIPPCDSRAYKMARVSERSHARMLRFDWLIRRVGSCVASIRMCAREGEPWAHDPLASPHTVPLCVRTRAIIGFSPVCFPLSRPFEMADMAILRKVSSRETHSLLL